MKKYLNKAEKNNVLILESFVSFLEKFTNELEKFKQSKAMIKYIKTAKTYCYKSLDIYFKDLDKVYIEQLLKEIRKMEVIAKYRKDAMQELENIKKINTNVTLDSDDFLLITEYALVTCLKCKLNGKDVENCELRLAYFKNDIPVFETDPDEGACPYTPKRDIIK